MPHPCTLTPDAMGDEAWVDSTAVCLALSRPAVMVTLAQLKTDPEFEMAHDKVESGSQ